MIQNKPILVFLHGFCESKKIWEEFVKPFQQEYQVLLIDLPGFGENTVLYPDYSMESGAAYVRNYLADQGIEKCMLIGHSMGGYIALAFAEKYPELLQGLCLFHSSALPDSEEKKQTRNKTINFIQKQGVDLFMDSFVAPLFYEGNREKNADAIKLLTRIGKNTPQEAIIGTIRGMRDRPDRTQVLQELDVPVLFIAGKQDGAVTLEQTLQQCYLPKESHVLFLNKTGHMGMFEKPAETSAELQGFIYTLIK